MTLTLVVASHLWREVVALVDSESFFRLSNYTRTKDQSQMPFGFFHSTLTVRQGLIEGFGARKASEGLLTF